MGGRGSTARRSRRLGPQLGKRPPRRRPGRGAPKPSQRAVGQRPGRRRRRAGRRARTIARHRSGPARHRRRWIADGWEARYAPDPLVILCAHGADGDPMATVSLTRRSNWPAPPRDADSLLKLAVVALAPSKIGSPGKPSSGAAPQLNTPRVRRPVPRGSTLASRGRPKKALRLTLCRESAAAQPLSNPPCAVVRGLATVPADHADTRMKARRTGRWGSGAHEDDGRGSITARAHGRSAAGGWLYGS